MTEDAPGMPDSWAESWDWIPFLESPPMPPPTPPTGTTCNINIVEGMGFTDGLAVYCTTSRAHLDVQRCKVSYALAFPVVSEM